MALPLRNPLIIALDVDEKSKAMDLAQELKSSAGGFKVGPRLVMKYGETLIHDLSLLAPVFVDMKHFDIPSTMISAVKSSFHAGASLVTVHALSGLKALTELAELEKELYEIRKFSILAVTILTSWDKTDIPNNFSYENILENVLSLAALVKKSGLNSVVCSSHEINFLTDLNMNLVTPGIRLDTNPSQDQKRIMTPKEAINKGATALVVGRPIIEADSPFQAANLILKSL